MIAISATPQCLATRIAETERRMAEYNERIIADLMMGRDPIEVENRAVELRVALHRMKGHRIAPASN